jgi:SAM-dependent methyltransferase
MRDDRFWEIAAAIEGARLLTVSARSPGGPADPRALSPGSGGPRPASWMPFDLFSFGALLLEAIPAAPGNRLLEVGAGPGPNLVLAQALGWDVHGIEIIGELAALARQAGIPVEEADAAGWGKYDAVWLNRPRRDPAAEEALELEIWDQMAPGAVVICANLEHPPPPSWFPVLDAWNDVRRGIWMKPRSNGAAGR